MLLSLRPSIALLLCLSYRPPVAAAVHAIGRGLSPFGYLFLFFGEIFCFFFNVLLVFLNDLLSAFSLDFSFVAKHHLPLLIGCWTRLFRTVDFFSR